MPFLSLAAVLIVTGIAAAFIVAALLADTLIHPPRMTDGKALYLYQRLSPADLQIDYEDVVFDVRVPGTAGGTNKLLGWWMSAPSTAGRLPSRRCVVLLHGFADGKVGSIAWAPLLLSLGLNVLSLDLRFHGESGGSRCTAGRDESVDVAGVIGQLRERFPKQCERLFLFGISMGAVVALKTSLEYSPVDGIVMESPYADFVTAARRAADIRGMPGGWCFTLAATIAQWRIGSNYAEVRPTALLKTVPCPVLWLHGDADRLVGSGDRMAIRKAINDRANESDRIVCIPDADHLLQPGTLDDRAIGALREFFEQSS